MKKGIALPMETLIAAIGIIAFFIIALALAIQAGLLTRDDVDFRACQLSILAQSKTDTTISDSPLKIDCTKRVINIKPKYIEADRKGVNTRLASYPEGKRVTSYNELNDNVLASFFAESMRRCWAMGGEGKEAVFNDESFIFKQRMCLICDEIRLQPEYGQTYLRGAALSSYLSSTQMPNIKTSMTYGDYLFAINDYTGPSQNMGIFGPETINGGKLCLEQASIQDPYEFKEGTYATVFIRDFSGAQIGCMATYVIPQENVRSLCDYIVN